MHGADVGAGLQQVGGEGMAQGVDRRGLGDAGFRDGGVQVALQALLVQVVATLLAVAAAADTVAVAAAWIAAQGRRREEPEPGEAFGGARVLGGERVRQMHAGAARVAVGLPDRVRGAQLRAQGTVERARQHDDAVLAALAVAHHDHLADEVDVFHAQAHAFEQAHAGAVEQAPEQARDAVAHAREQRLHLDVREHDGDALLRHRPAEFAQPRHVDAEHFAVEKEQRTQRLAMRGRRDATLVGEHRQERLHLHHAELARMAQTEPAHEVAHPVDVRLLGAQAVVQVAQALAQGVEEAQGSGPRSGHGGRGGEVRSHARRQALRSGGRRRRRRRRQRPPLPRPASTFPLLLPIDLVHFHLPCSLLYIHTVSSRRSRVNAKPLVHPVHFHTCRPTQNEDMARSSISR